MAQQLQDDLAKAGLLEWGTTKQAAEALNLSESYLNKARISGDGPPYTKFGHAVRYHLPTVQQWALARAQSSTSARAAA